MRAEEVTTVGCSEALNVRLDGLSVRIPAERHSVAGIRSYLEALALEQQRVLCLFTINGAPAKSSAQEAEKISGRIEAETCDIADLPAQQLGVAIEQIADARAAAQNAATLVLINEPGVARELWWNLIPQLKAPLITLSFLPETALSAQRTGASMLQLRKWQLQQLATIIRDVDASCALPETAALSNALENRVLPWLENLNDSLLLWQQTLAAGARLRERAA